MRRHRNLSPSLPGLSVLAYVALDPSVHRALGQMGPAIAVSSSVSDDLTPPFNIGPPSTGGAPATPEQDTAFASQGFNALNWPAGPQQAKPGSRERDSPLGDVS